MCDRITQVQDQINQIAEHMCNAVGMLQQSAPPAILPGRLELLSTPIKNELSDFTPKDMPFLFASLVTKSVKEMDLLIDMLPSESHSESEMNSTVRRLDKENRESVAILQRAMGVNESLLARIQSALKDIAECEIEIDRRKM